MYRPPKMGPRRNNLQSGRNLNIVGTWGRAIAQAVSRRLPIAAARVRAVVRSCGICGGQSGTGAGFLQVLRFPLPIFIPPIAPQSPSSIIWCWYNRLTVVAVPSGLSLTPLRIIIKNNYNSRYVACRFWCIVTRIFKQVGCTIHRSSPCFLVQ
jgi:hypothetical protein